MLRKIFWLALIIMFYFWITDSQENVKKFKSIYQYVIGKINKIDLDLNISSKTKKRKW